MLDKYPSSGGMNPSPRKCRWHLLVVLVLMEWHQRARCRQGRVLWGWLDFLKCLEWCLQYSLTRGEDTVDWQRCLKSLECFLANRWTPNEELPVVAGYQVFSAKNLGQSYCLTSVQLWRMNDGSVSIHLCMIRQCKRETHRRTQLLQVANRFGKRANHPKANHVSSFVNSVVIVKTKSNQVLKRTNLRYDCGVQEIHW
jgi:hypothetical protein